MSYIAFFNRGEEDSKEIRFDMTFGPNVSPEAVGVAFKNRIVAETKALYPDTYSRILAILTGE